MLSLDFGGGFAVDQAGSARRHRVELAGKKIKHRYQFSIEGVRELEAFHQRVLNNLKLAFSAFMSGDVRMARTLIEEKTGLRNAELAASESHLRRLRDGRAESIETSSLHLDVLRDLKRIHSHICSVAYPVLEPTGELHPNRLRESEPGLLAAPEGSPMDTKSSAP